MEKREVSALDLPRTFSINPEEKKGEFWQAIKLGYELINQRFGKLAASCWEPKESNAVICQTPEEFKEEVFADSPNIEWKKDSPKNLPPAKVSYITKKVYFNSSNFINPLEVAQTAAYATVHAWAGKQPIKLQEVNIPAKDTTENLQYIANLAHNALADFSACEALGLLTAPITQIKPLQLMSKSRNGAFLKDMAYTFGPNIEDIIFRIAQGEFTGYEIDALNKQMGPDPSGRFPGGFYEYGFLYPLGCIQASLQIGEDMQLLKPEELNRVVIGSLMWTFKGLKITSFETLMKNSLRTDVVEAGKLVKQGFQNGSWQNN